MMRHTLAEGWLLLRRRILISVVLAFTLAMPICLAGLTTTISLWLGPVFAATSGNDGVAVLLHPHLAETERTAWLDRLRSQHPRWRITTLPPEQLIERMSHWFPYLQDLFEGEDKILPPLVEIAGADAQELEQLGTSEAVIAVGPRTSLHQAASRMATRTAWMLGLVAAILLSSAALLAAVWVHLELYRHADEITIMRLIGATEAAIRGPFIVAVAAPGVLAAALSITGTLLLALTLSKMIATLGLPPLGVPLLVLVLQALLSCLLPLAAAMVTLSRHARLDLPPDVG